MRVLVLTLAVRALLAPLYQVSSGPSETVSREGWKTFSSESLAVRLDYPSEWTVQEQEAGTIFASPQGFKLLLKRGPTDASPAKEPVAPNEQCSTTTNAYGVEARSCVQTMSFTYWATVTLRSSSGEPHRLALSTRTKRDAKIFQAIVDSIRPLEDSR